ncbi:MAG: heavy-metal-associated domain-containing protein [Synechococcales bacterium]|nr:heavy-metal-associated domain-containing protein [Synechococcales bacterium]
MQMMQFTVSDMACAACVQTITQAVQSVDPAATVDADTVTKAVTVQTNATTAQIKEAIATAGYSPSQIGH